MWLGLRSWISLFLFFHYRGFSYQLKHNIIFCVIRTQAYMFYSAQNSKKKHDEKLSQYMLENICHILYSVGWWIYYIKGLWWLIISVKLVKHFSKRCRRTIACSLWFHASLLDKVAKSCPQRKSLMAKWLGLASQEYEMYCHGLKVIGSILTQIELGVWSTSV